MGLFSSVIHLHDVDQASAVEALNQVLSRHRFRLAEQVACPRGGPAELPDDDAWVQRGPYYLVSDRGRHWLTIIQAHFALPDAPHEADLSSALGASLGCYALSLIVHDDDVLFYNLSKSGKNLDGYTSHPQYFEQRPLSKRAIEEQRHDPRAFAPLLPPGTDLAQLRTLLDRGYWSAYDAGLLDEDGVPPDDDDSFVFEGERMVALGNLLQLHELPGDYPYTGWRESPTIPWQAFIALRYKR